MSQYRFWWRLISPPIEVHRLDIGDVDKDFFSLTPEFSFNEWHGEQLTGEYRYPAYTAPAEEQVDDFREKEGLNMTLVGVRLTFRRKFPRCDVDKTDSGCVVHLFGRGYRYTNKLYPTLKAGGREFETEDELTKEIVHAWRIIENHRIQPEENKPC